MEEEKKKNKLGKNQTESPGSEDKKSCCKRSHQEEQRGIATDKNGGKIG